MRHLLAPAALGLTVGFTLACADFGTFRTASVEQATEPLTPGSCAANTELSWNEPPPAEAVGGFVPDHVEIVQYPAEPGALKGWVMRPEGVEGPAPTLVFFHGGFSWSPAHAEVLRPWVEDGWVVFMPALRGENGNPGTYQYLCGEIDDAAAAVRWIAEQPYVDDTRLVTFGHSVGGAVSGLLALRDGLPIAASGSAGGLFFEEVLQGQGPMLPFDPNDTTELRRRLLVAHLGELKRPHHAWMGEADALRTVVDPVVAKAAELSAPLIVHRVPGNHQTCLQPALDAFRASEALQNVRGSAK